MILNKNIMINITARNITKISEYYKDENIIINSEFEINQLVLFELFKGSKFKLDCKCDNCNEEYKQHIYRLYSFSDRQLYCGKCLFIFAQEKMKITCNTEEYRQKKSEIMTNFYKTDYGKQLKTEVGKKRSEYLKSRPDLLEIFTNNLTHRYGEEHYNYNPNKSEYKKYMYEVRKLTMELKEVIN